MRWLGVCVLVGALSFVSIGGADSHPPADAIVLKLGRGWPEPKAPLWVRVGQRFIVHIRKNALLEPVWLEPRPIVRRSRAPGCSPSRCNAFVAERPGMTAFVATELCGPGAACIAWGVSVYVEPARCDAGPVSAVPIDRAPRQSGSLRAIPLSASGTGGQPSSYTLARFSDRYPIPGYYNATVDWGDGSPQDSNGIAVAITGTGGTGFVVVGRHFYCHAGTYTAAIQIGREPSLPPQITAETVTVRVKVSARARDDALLARM